MWGEGEGEGEGEGRGEGRRGGERERGGGGKKSESRERRRGVRGEGNLGKYVWLCIDMVLWCSIRRESVLVSIKAPCNISINR